jgi:outer membrane lipoprotein SlyB
LVKGKLMRSKIGWRGLIAAMAVLGLGGCASSLSGDTYHRGEAMRAQSVEMGVVDSVRFVVIEGTRTGVGTAAGAALGGIAGSTIGGGYRANTAGAIGGAVIGGVAGHAIEEGSTRKQGVEVTVRLDQGRMIAVVQEATEEFRPGDRVRLVSDGYRTRVSH